LKRSRHIMYKIAKDINKKKGRRRKLSG
jgi:hypothetical protein